MPRDLARLVKDARHGRMRVDLDLKRLDSCGHRLHSAMNRATIGIMTASLVVGSSIVMTVAEGPTLFGVPLLTLFRFVRLPDRFREQPLDHPFDLALRSALREAAAGALIDATRLKRGIVIGAAVPVTVP
jgi:hypothetical protein